MQKYQSAKVTVKTSGEYYIEWYNINPSTNLLQRIRKSFDLNRISDQVLRRSQSIEIQSALNLALANGWNYFETVQPAIQANITLVQALKKSMPIMLANLRPDTVRSYPSIMNIFIAWLTKQKLHDTAPGKFTAYQFTQYLATREDKSISNINNHIIVIKKLFKTMKTILSVITESPLENIKTLKVQETDRYEAITHNELKCISDYLEVENEALFLLYTRCIFYASTRPVSLKFLQRSQIDFENNTIQIFGTETKGKRNTKKQLLTPLKEAFMRHDVHLLTPDKYVFGKGFAPADSVFSSLTTRAQEKWKLAVDKLGIDKRMYALRHTYAQMYIEENEIVDLSWLQRQMEHSTLAETEKYVSKRKMKIIDENRIYIPKY